MQSVTDENDDDEVFNDASLHSVKAISAALEGIVDEHDPQHWHAALAVYVGSAIRHARLEQGMPLETAQKLVDAIRDFALGEENAMAGHWYITTQFGDTTALSRQSYNDFGASLFILGWAWVIVRLGQYEERFMIEPNVSQILDGIRAIAVSDTMSVNEQLDALTKIAEAAQEHEDKLSFPEAQGELDRESRLQ
jgi:hypothetical protein